MVTTLAMLAVAVAVAAVPASAADGGRNVGVEHKRQKA